MESRRSSVTGCTRVRAAQTPVTLHIINGSAVCIGRGPRLNLHAAHAFTVARALEGRLLVRFEGDMQWQACTTAVIAPDVVHELDAEDGIAFTAMIGPDSRDGRRLPWRTTISHDPPPAYAGEPYALYRRLIDLHAAPTSRPLDPRVRKVLKLIYDSPGVHMRVDDLAGAVTLSPSRLVHLFSEQTKTSIKRYSLWLRLIAAFRAMTQGASLTDTAYAVGFADPAHLSRTYQRFLGLYPSDVIRHFGPREGFSSLSTTAIPDSVG